MANNSACDRGKRMIIPKRRQQQHHINNNCNNNTNNININNTINNNNNTINNNTININIINNVNPMIIATVSVTLLVLMLSPPLPLLEGCSAFVFPRYQHQHQHQHQHKQQHQRWTRHISEISGSSETTTLPSYGTILQMVLSSQPPPSSSLSTGDSDSDSDSDSDTNGKKCKFMYMTKDEDRTLKEQGDLEASLMQTPTALEAIDLARLTKQAQKQTKYKTRSSSSAGAGGFGGGGGGGFGGGGAKKGGGGKKKKTKNKTKKEPPRAATATPPHPAAAGSPLVRELTRIIREDGLVRIDNVLSGSGADDLRDYLIDLRKRAQNDVETGKLSDSQERFADVLLNQNRCDLKIPLGPKPVHNALLDVLNKNKNNDNDNDNDNDNVATPSLVREVIEGVFDHYVSASTTNNNSHLMGSQASLWELNCFMSNSGARRQLVHADCVCLEPIQGLDHTDTNSPSDPAGEPILLTCFIALQDIDPSMGPTVFMPKTHNIRSHNVFFETGRDSDSTKSSSINNDDGSNANSDSKNTSEQQQQQLLLSPKNGLLESSKSVIGAPLPKGSCILFDPRVLHCAGANQCSDPDKTRALFYMTFKNPKVDSPGCPSTSGYGIASAELTMDELVSDLLWMNNNNNDNDNDGDGDGGGDHQEQDQQAQEQRNNPEGNTEEKSRRRVPQMVASP